MVYGTVTDPRGAPLKGICIDLTDHEDDGYLRYGHHATTDVRGRYVVDASDYRRETSWYDVRIEAYDCRPDPRHGNRFELLRSEERRADFTLPLGGAIEGVVRDQSGDPVDGLCVAAHDGRHEGASEAIFGSVATELTDAEGRFRFAGLGGGFRFRYKEDQSDPAPHVISAAHCDDDRFEPQLGGVRSPERGTPEGARHHETGGETWISMRPGETITDVVVTVQPADSPSLLPTP